MALVENRGAKLWWDEQGTGEPLLLIMGLGWTSKMWERSRALLAEEFRTIAFDNRGVGESSVPAGPYLIPLMASDAAAVLDAAGVDGAHVYGVSMGGMIAQEFALLYPARVRSLILGCTAAGGPNAVQPEAAALQTLMRDDLTPDEAAEAVNPFIYAKDTNRSLVDEDMAIRKKWNPTREGFLGQLQGLMMWEADSRLRQIEAPTLVIHGDADRLIPVANGKRVASQIRGAKFHSIEGASHIYSTDRPGAAEKAVVEFLASIR